MPACIAHMLFAQRVLRLCEQRGIPLYDRELALIGAQGPDVFFFHRAFPWQPGKRGFRAGISMHHGSPQKLMEAFRDSVKAETIRPDFARGYMQGFLCHYALDRTAHPFILYWQERLQREQPDYGKTDSQYHFRIESALDTLLLRRETGRTIRDFPLTSLIPPDREGRYAALGRLYLPLYRKLFHQPDVTVARIVQAPGDMRQALFWMTDRRGLRSTALRGAETLLRTGPIGTSLLRPLDADDWDYANEAHRRWHNPFRPELFSTMSFYELCEQAAVEAVDMIRAFLEGLTTDGPLSDFTGDRGFSSNLRGIYDDKEW